MENGLGGSKGIAGKGHKDHIVIKTARFASISRVAQWQQNNGGGGSVVFPAKHVSGGELKKALDLMFQNQYSVQLQRDQYTVTLPKAEYNQFLSHQL